MRSYPEWPAQIERHYHEVCETFERLIGKLSGGSCQTHTHGKVEELIDAEGMELMRQMVQAYLNQRSEQERVHERHIGADGQARTHRRCGCTRRLETRFGEVVVHRIGYGGRGMQSVFPLDGALNLPPDKYSHGLRKALAEAVIEGSFDHALAHLDRLGGGHLGKRQAEEVVVRLSEDFEAFYSLREATKAAAEAAEPKQRTRLRPGEKRHRTRSSHTRAVPNRCWIARTNRLARGRSRNANALGRALKRTRRPWWKRALSRRSGAIPTSG